MAREADRMGMANHNRTAESVGCWRSGNRGGLTRIIDSLLQDEENPFFSESEAGL